MAKVARVVLGILLCLLCVAAFQREAAALEVRVGVVAYQDFDRQAADFERLFADLATSLERPVSFQLAIGTYGDIIHWLDKGSIDVALLTPGVFAEALRSESSARPACTYLASHLLPPAQVATVATPPQDLSSRGVQPAVPREADKGKAVSYRDRYHAVCVAAERSPLKTIDDVRRAWQAGRVRFVFVDPLSASGRIAPTFALKRAGIEPAPDEVEFSYSHTNSLRALAAVDANHERVAFVWDGAWRQADDLPAFRRIEFPAFEALQVPADVVVARAGFPHADRVIELLASHVDAGGEHDFVRFDDWRDRYHALLSWTDDVHVPAEGDEVQAVSLDGLAHLLGHYARTRPADEPMRLALVLSGGGAKCSYQIGAVTALEETLEKLRREAGDDDLAISLVAGTSGGAINALAVALGTSRTAEGQAELRRAWQSLDQREIVRPSRLVRGNMGLWFVCVELAVVLWLVRKLVRAPTRRVWVAVTALLVIAAVQILMSYVPFKPWTWLGRSHALHHVWLWATFGVEWGGWCLLLVALAAAAWQWRCSRAGNTLTLPRWATTWGLTIALLGLPLAQLATILFYERTLSDGKGIERRLLQSFSELAQFRASELGRSPLELAGPATQERLQSLGREIFAHQLLARDLVITGSCLERSSEALPSDLYFYAPASSPSPPADYGERGVALAERPEMLLDVVMGSGSIFPVFPPRTLHDFPRQGESVELVDGGFAHNSPIEAAVRWGATHIVLIEADPRERGERHNLLQNAAGAFSHLYYQAQLVDARSREKERVVIFSLRPSAPHVCMLDFADNLIDESIEKGYREARGESLAGASGVTGRRSFRKELGEPFFWDPSPAVAAE
jgi:predicted acylesterase/phospholipase RssA/ABC-type phosphate/phosphonate transport system substrate-binding protein